MIEALKRLIGPEYLVVAEPGPVGQLWPLYLALAVLFALGLGLALWVLLGPGRESQSADSRAWAWLELWVCLAGVGTVVGRFLSWPGWSARIWPYSLALLAMLGMLAYRFRRLELPVWWAAQLRILSLLPLPGCAATPPDTRKRTLWYLLGLLLHLVGIGFVIAGRYQWPAGVAPLLLLALLVPQAPLILRHRPPNLMALTPLLAAYAATLLWRIYLWEGITVIGWQGLAFPNPMVSLFYVDGVIVAALALTVLCQLAVTAAELHRPAILWNGAVIGLLVVTLSWAGVVYLGKRTHGATASDPYAYAQMGVDLAERGTFLHRFSLFQPVIPLHIAWAPLQPVGYHIPRNELGDCPSVWATGASVLLAAGYLLLGESGLYVTIPIVALAALAATWALVQEVLSKEPKPVRHLSGALAVGLLASSPEHVDRLLVPMADAPAQLFTVLGLWFALRGMHQRSRLRNRALLFFLAGLCLGWAYWVRHTQLVLALPLTLAAVLACYDLTPARNAKDAERPPLREVVSALVVRAIPFLGALVVGAFVAATPDIIYRWRVFGGPLATETTELPLMAIQHIGPVAWQMLRDSLAAGEWGYLFPLAILGSYYLTRRLPREAAILGSAFFAVLLLHFTYRSLRLRDLISIFPILDLVVAYGSVVLVQHVRSVGRQETWPLRLGTTLLPALVIAWVVVSLSLSRWAMIDNLWKPGWASFGYMRPQHREAFDRLADLTPPEAVIGASLNAGAIMLYSERDAIRPYDSWTEHEWLLFLKEMRTARRPVYLLDDGDLMSQFIAGERTRRGLTPIEELEVPLFYTRDRHTGWLYRLDWDDEP